MNDLRYPIGKYRTPEQIDEVQIKEWIEELRRFPDALRNELANIPEEALERLHREDGWTVRQLVHHISDSHLNSYLRFKLALTEDNPTIKAYDEVNWSNLPDSKLGPVGPAIEFISALHTKWILLLERMDAEQWDRTFYHPEMGRSLTLKWNLGLYAWHGKHHLAHIRQALGRG